MSPIITTMSAPAGRGRRVRGSSTGGGGSWTFPNAGGGALGPGANAPSWSGKTTYTEELFGTDIPTASTNAAGFRGYQGFSGVFNNVTYPTVDTPLGSKRVLQVTYPGQTETISAVDMATTLWPFRNTDSNSSASARISGTWSGTLVFEKSTDGGASWSSMTVLNSSNASVSSTTANGSFRANTGSTLEHFRVRASAWTSGTATVSVGMQGGQAAARFDAGSWTGSPTRIYTRALFYTDPNWANNTNTGTKFFFFSSDQSNGHYTGTIGGPASEGFSGAFVGTQFNDQPGLNRNMSGSVALANGQWMDLEFLLTTGTTGAADGVVQTWVNGVQAHNLSDVQFFNSTDTTRWTGLFCDPTYGGGFNPPPSNIFFRIAGWYRESAP